MGIVLTVLCVAVVLLTISHWYCVRALRRLVDLHLDRMAIERAMLAELEARGDGDA
jgi:hypothetical protein